MLALTDRQQILSCQVPGLLLDSPLEGSVEISELGPDFG